MCNICKCIHIVNNYVYSSRDVQDTGLFVGLCDQNCHKIPEGMHLEPPSFCILSHNAICNNISSLLLYTTAVGFQNSLNRNSSYTFI